MKIYFVILILIFGFVQNHASCEKINVEKTNTVGKAMNDKTSDGVILSEEVRDEKRVEKGDISFKIVSVEEKLTSIGARYENDKLVDENGQEIKFYKPPVRGIFQGFDEDREQATRY